MSAISPNLMLVAGEPSGDLLGAQLMKTIGMLSEGRARFFGVGGEAMEAEGLESLFPISETSVMGLREIVPRIPRILERVRETADFAIAHRPDAVVLIDSPEFTHRIAKRLAKRAPHITVIKYVAPQVWASRPWRAKACADYLDHVLCLLPFEPPLFEEHGLKASFVGHPALERVETFEGGEAFRAAHRIPPTTPLLAVLPGSRLSEVRSLMPVFHDAAALVAEAIPEMRVVVPTVPTVAEIVGPWARTLPGRPIVLEKPAEKRAAFDAADVALAASGTVTTELALAEVPMVVGYKVGWLTGALARLLVTAPHVTLLNLIAQEAVIPELLQESCTPTALADELLRLIQRPEAAEWQLGETKRALEAMGLGGEAPSLRAAKAVLESAAEPKILKDKGSELLEHVE